MSGKKIGSVIFYLSSLLCASLLWIPGSAMAQYPGMRGGMGMGGGYGMMGGMGMGMYGGGFDGTGGSPTIATVKYGEKVYDAVFGDLLEYKVYYIQVLADSVGKDYYDDGTHGDEVAFDGMPSLIYITRDSYLGPFSIKYKHQLENMLKQTQEMGPLLFYNLNVATKDPESKVEKIKDRNKQMESEVLEFIKGQLAQFEGYDDEKYVKAIDPTLFESLEGFGGFDTGFSAGGYLPDMPQPPGLPQPEMGQTPTEDVVSPQSPPPARPQRSGPAGALDRVGDTLSGLSAQEAANELP
ncbi:MAG: hypothetical protein AB1656_26445 [Candidatus Omnitrophota bacterium]